MAENGDNKSAFYRKAVWAIYTVLVIAVILVLVFFVAQDNEERLFYSLMTAAASYVFRPTDTTIRKLASRLFGVSIPAPAEDE